MRILSAIAIDLIICNFKKSNIRYKTQGSTAAKSCSELQSYTRSIILSSDMLQKILYYDRICNVVRMRERVRAIGLSKIYICKAIIRLAYEDIVLCKLVRIRLGHSPISNLISGLDHSYVSAALSSGTAGTAVIVSSRKCT